MTPENMQVTMFYAKQTSSIFKSDFLDFTKATLFSLKSDSQKPVFQKRFSAYECLKNRGKPTCMHGKDQIFRLRRATKKHSMIK